jgi:tRNA-binding protein
MKEISWAEFEQVELRVGTIVQVEDFPEARKPAYKLEVDFGPEIGRKRSSAQIKDLYAREELVGKQVIGVVNFPAKRIAGFASEALITGFYGPDGVILAVPDKKAPNGAKLG